MNDPFLRFLTAARWTSAIVATMFHVRFLLLTGYGSLHDPNPLLTGFYFLTGLGHESYAVYFILDGIAAGLILQHRHGAASEARAASRHLGGLYRVVLPGLLIGACLDLAGTRLGGDRGANGGVYTAFPAFSTLTLTFPAFAGNLLMLQPFAVPEFGSNSMLYLPAWLCWSCVLLALYRRAGARATPHGRYLRSGIALATLALLPYQFVIWAAIWLAGVGLVFLCEARQWRPPLLAGIALFAAALLLSRVLAPLTHAIPQPARDVIIQCGFLLVGLAFATIAWARYPRRGPQPAPCAAQAASDALTGWRDRAASFTFFFHFPVIMLLAGWGAARLGLPLMQPPSAVVLGWFACLVAASAVTAAIVTTAIDRLLHRWSASATVQAAGRR